LGSPCAERVRRAPRVVPLRALLYRSRRADPRGLRCPRQARLLAAALSVLLAARRQGRERPHGRRALSAHRHPAPRRLVVQSSPGAGVPYAGATGLGSEPASGATSPASVPASSGAGAP